MPQHVRMYMPKPSLIPSCGDEVVDRVPGKWRPRSDMNSQGNSSSRHTRCLRMARSSSPVIGCSTDSDPFNRSTQSRARIDLLTPQTYRDGQMLWRPAESASLDASRIRFKVAGGKFVAEGVGGRLELNRRAEPNLGEAFLQRKPGANLRGHSAVCSITSSKPTRTTKTFTSNSYSPSSYLTAAIWPKRRL